MIEEFSKYIFNGVEEGYIRGVYIFMIILYMFGMILSLFRFRKVRLIAVKDSEFLRLKKKGFTEQEIINEKLKLFRDSKTIIFNGDND